MTTIVLNAFETWKFGGPGDDPLMEQARRDVYRLMRAYEFAAGIGAGQALLRELESAVGNVGEAKAAFEAWTHLIETLVQAAERTYGAKSGLGELKNAQVKGALVRLLVRTPNLRLPVPDYLQPFVIDLGVGWAMDTLVLILNENDLWDYKNVTPGRPRSAALRLKDRVATAVVKRKPSESFAGLLRRFTTWLVIWKNPLEQDVAEAVRIVELTEGVGIQSSLRKFGEFTQWLIDHRQQVHALIAVAAAAVNEAEQFLSMSSGARKKEYARDLVLAFLEYVGILQSEGGPLYSVVSSALDWFIDAIVGIFNRRDPSFGHVKRATR